LSLDVILSWCVGGLVYFSGNKETLEVKQFLKDLSCRDLFFWDY